MDERAPLEDLARFPLLTALFGRRSRRFGVGMSIPDGPLAYASSQPPLPLTDLERTLLVLCGAGVSGWHLGMEHTATSDPHHGCNYPVRLTGRVAEELSHNWRCCRASTRWLSTAQQRASRARA